ncbi:hypothetical protein [Hasllibacter halocynthiae]|uniref:hypothetical protein n=1 Tax=Hasllibacter halocynthiae TaxID=595589 RepID=UPI000D076553|nr:hypothetical protein [Hasllibacter halocynthiae]
MLLVAYGGLYPALREKTLPAMIRIDLVCGTLALLVAGLLFAGGGTGFSLVLLDVPWWAFSVLTFAILEVPFFLWFVRRHDLDLGP